MKFSTKKLDEIAEDIQLQVDLKSGNVKTKFNHLMKESFLAFSERERYNLINYFLFENFKIDQLKQNDFIT